MEYSIQCRYSIVEQTFMFIIKSLKDKYQFTWLISNVDKPVYVLTNNNIVFKSYLQDNFVMFEVAESEKPLNEHLVMTKTVPMLKFETDEQNLQIIYDFDHLPNYKDKNIGKIIHQFLDVAGGGFLEDVSQYNVLENNIGQILDQYSNSKNNVEEKAQEVVQSINVQRKKPTRSKTKNTQNKSAEKVVAKTTKSTTRKATTKKSVKTTTQKDETK